MPFFLVYDPPNSAGPYLIGNRKGSRDKQFVSVAHCFHRQAQCGRAVKQFSKIHEFASQSVALGHCIHVRAERSLAVPVTMKKAHRVVGSPGEADEA